MKGEKNMSEVIQGCNNNYSVDELYEKFGIDEKETNTCLSCKNIVMEGGTFSCRFIIEQISKQLDQ